ncbi:hypothetical protein HHL16_03320 [Pseudoflavitalea sp. G-6-1-2]|uniref:hypothetical protein n=1 Tax=Pseudoflavitalea sp. G-6-1-2 TaxID=2728841 RepID=UPI00146EEE25|nr:hypothetical protein [Pseudoflavitalea sp. G-6-1-2]NML19885.1 hypothetical protein [Pseudoflavitalea sp. G-6-1-2]
MRSLLTLTLLIGCACSAFAQTDTVNANTHNLAISQLPEGISRYLVYNVDSISGQATNSDLWERSITYGKITNTNQPVILFEWKWFRNESLHRHTKAIADRRNLAPISEVVLFKNYAYMGYKFANGLLTTDTTVAGNRVNKNFRVALNPPVLNWEMDMETFSTLPIKAVAQKFVIAFLDPANPTPGYYTYEVAASEELALNKEVKVKCWVLKIQYGNGAYALFWISAQSHEVLKMKEYFNGTYRYKVKLY